MYARIYTHKRKRALLSWTSFANKDLSLSWAPTTNLMYLFAKKCRKSTPLTTRDWCAPSVRVSVERVAMSVAQHCIQFSRFGSTYAHAHTHTHNAVCWIRQSYRFLTMGTWYRDAGALMWRVDAAGTLLERNQERCTWEKQTGTLGKRALGWCGRTYARNPHAHSVVSFQMRCPWPRRRDMSKISIARTRKKAQANRTLAVH